MARVRLSINGEAKQLELIAAAHSGCFTMALAIGLQSAGYTPTELRTEAAVTLQAKGQGFRISRSAPTIRAASTLGGPLSMICCRAHRVSFAEEGHR